MYQVELCGSTDGRGRTAYLIEDFLRSVTVMHVPVDDQDLLGVTLVKRMLK